MARKSMIIKISVYKAKWKNQLKNFSPLICLFLLLLNSGCLKHIYYDQSQLEIFFKRKENIQLSFETAKGIQIAFYVPPLLKPHSVPKKLAILYPGIYAVALGWYKFIRLEDDLKTGYLLIDYPGRGLSEGFMDPEEIYKNTEGALAALSEHFGLDRVNAELCLMGHSFGTGAALQMAARQEVSRIVLVAPFDTLRQAVAQRSIILAALMPAQIDNVKLIRKILTNDDKPSITIIHGSNDTSLPVEMGRKLAAVDPDLIDYYEIPQGDHSSILTTHRDLIFHSLTGTNENEKGL
jgi:pimeloyl-ACP methyl ester carboxylesterase